MATNTYVALDKVTVTSATPSITFTNINQGYTDLVLVLSGTKTVASGEGIGLRVGNGSLDTGSNYSETIVWGNGSGSGSDRTTSQTRSRITYYGAWISGAFSVNTVHFNNYSNTTTFKPILSRANTSSQGVDATVSLWRSTAAINTISVYPFADSFDVGTTASLYGIRAEGLTPAPKATGGVISSDSTYMYHTFTSTGNFTPSQSLTCDYFIVAGGGGAGATVGGGWSGGGGGGGGYRTFSSVSFASGTAYTATIGAGGAGGSGSGGTGSVGSNTTLIGGAISTATSGGGGGGTSKENGNTQTNGTAGGSGGGAPQNTVNVNGGAGNSGGYTPVEGYAGFSNTTGGFAGTGQGGGAGGVGIAGTYLVEYPFNGVIAFDGAPYSGGGGARWLTADLMNGVPNSGNGGYSKNDGTGTNYTGGTGGSGAVVIRYAKG
jgi:hypothetical protein